MDLLEKFNKKSKKESKDLERKGLKLLKFQGFKRVRTHKKNK